MRLSPAFLQTTHKKSTLRIALLISLVIHGAVLLWVRFDPSELVPPLAPPTIEVTLLDAPPEESLAIEVVPEPDPDPTVPLVTPEISQSPQESPEPLIPVAESFMGELADAESPVSSDRINWEEIVSTYADEATIENIEQERLREAMWRKTFSVMFAPPEDWLIEDKPYLPDLQFEADKIKRLGIQISENCYLGFPGIDPQTVDTDLPGWSGGGPPAPTVNLITCRFGG